MTLTFLTAFIWKDQLRRYMPTRARYLLPVIAFWTLPIQLLLNNFSSKLGADWGPLVTELCTFYPLLLLAAFTSGQMLAALNLNRFGMTAGQVAPPVLSYAFFSSTEKFCMATFSQLIGMNNLFTRTGLQLLSAIGFTILSPSKFIFFVLPAVMHTIWYNPHYIAGSTTAVLDATLENHNYKLVDRKESLTGYISVLESIENEFRVMRCDHSLLGGEWLLNDQRRKRNQVMQETIYPVFTMLEAVRLVETETERKDSESTFLNIGLGIGTCPKALINMGVQTTIVELDPVVHYFASKYFDLPQNHTSFIQDAVVFVDNNAPKYPGSYDYIVHDVFTGGAEPASLFTYEFLSGLYQLLKEDGVIAINYAGDLGKKPTQLVLNTILSVFPTCRVFRDQPPEKDKDNEAVGEFINMILFCRKKPNGGLRFRAGTPDDWRGSLSRKALLPPPKHLEIGFPKNIGKGGEVLKRGGEAELEKYHRDAAKHHWKIMRTVLPDAIWENW